MITPKSIATVHAFSLVELLTVVAIMGLLTVAGIPALSSLSSSGQINQTITEVTGLLEQARQYAIAHNTYVWVAFSTETTDAGDNLILAVVSSSDGTNPSTTGNYGTVPSNTLQLISPIRTFRQVHLAQAGTFTATQITRLSSLPVTSSANNLGSYAFSIKIPTRATSNTFPQAVQFTPSGEASNNNDGPIDLLEFALQPQKGTVVDNKNVAVVRVNGLTGQSFVYRP